MSQNIDRPLNILLVRPHSHLRVARNLQSFLHLEPLELEIVAGGIPDGENIVILDIALEKDPVLFFEQKVREFNPDIIGFTCYSNQAAIVKDLSTRAKSILPGVITIAGGIHPTIIPNDFTGTSLDLIVRGEGGTAFTGIVARYRGGESLASGNAVIAVTDPAFAELTALKPPPFPPVEEIPRPRRNLLDRSKYFSVWTSPDKNNRLETMYPNIATIRTSTGCAFDCNFCVVHHMMNGKYLQRTPEDVVDEIAGIQEEYIYFVDDETFLNHNRLTRIAELLKERGIKKKYVSWARVDTIVSHPELFRLWKEVGLHIVYVGLEAMDESRLKDYGKRTTVDMNWQAIKILRDTGILLHASLMVDPGFSVQDFRNLEKVIIDLIPAEVSFTVFSPSPGTDLAKKHKDDYIVDPYLYYDCMHTILPTKLPLTLFYAHFAKLYRIGWQHNPLRRNKVKVPFREIIRSIVNGTKYIISMRNIYKDYPPELR
ncbi:MAG: cobalamin B12-binding domain-containing protein [Geobacteraceae bacterium]|nr:cobalamin B12-binding domain-containing protein [Geobacteraceae bacterium]